MCRDLGAEQLEDAHCGVGAFRRYEDVVVVVGGDRVGGNPRVGERARDRGNEADRLQIGLHLERDHREGAHAFEPGALGARLFDDRGRALVFLEGRQRNEVFREPFARREMNEAVVRAAQTGLHPRQQRAQVGFPRHLRAFLGGIADAPQNVSRMLGLLAAAFVLTSPDIAPGATIPSAYVWNNDGCHGDNVSPALQWSGAPPGAKSLALVMFDPDAPSGHGWYHWLVWNLSPDRTEFKRGSVSAAARQGRNDFGAAGYGGPCPPPGPAHRYVFTLYALAVGDLGLDAGASWQAVMPAVRAHTIAKATLQAKYGR